MANIKDIKKGNRVITSRVDFKRLMPLSKGKWNPSFILKVGGRVKN